VLDSVTIDNSIARSGGAVAFNAISRAGAAYHGCSSSTTLPKTVPDSAVGNDRGGAVTVQDCLGQRVPYITPMVVAIEGGEFRVACSR
jgi:hypothetical protein